MITNRITHLLRLLDKLLDLSSAHLFPRDESSVCTVFHDLANAIGNGRDDIDCLFSRRSNGVSCISKVPRWTAGH